ncbi:hypothetical protein [Actinokineospora globicatena]|uniref:hypothetical protein n=1 Tax=Actinokineospora globicatena TaxID=103729 RepID=UPI0020A3C0FF|nr:hypothetical protein [Actinokineospora globicatena]MCP2302828.1 AAA ATPase domain [Actinokineospora globicatena]GLW78789.1 hypothetical protein Aglo01_32710 [Actinokineospora globicatena]GLW84543.1 hypothetical protein Aglo02_21830 [Actinokineospora globicatena]
MSGVDPTPERERRRNPYTAMAVATTSLIDGDAATADVTVVTDAMRRAYRTLDDYLEAEPENAASAGVVMALLGNYGMGKTHLAVRLVRRARAALGGSTKAIYLDANAEDFLSLYLRFMREVTKEALVTQVRDYYADVVAASLQETGLSGDALQALTAGQVTPQRVIRELGMLESALLRRVQETLVGVTGDHDFSTVLTLLLRNGFDDAVWLWLTGGEPDEILVDRGITRRIDNELAALEALRVIALLFSGLRNRFVLVIDELDKIFSAHHRPNDTLMARFQDLLAVSARTGACLVLCGLPDVWEVLTPAVRARIPVRVDLAGLTEAEITEFLLESHRSVLDQDGIEPFTQVAVRTIGRLTRGYARDVIRLCRKAFRLADNASVVAGRDVLVDEVVLQAAAADEFGAPNLDDVVGQIWRLAERQGWNPHRDHMLGASVLARADFWITFPEFDSGCALLLAPSLLADGEVARLLDRVAALRAAAPGIEVVVVVVGVPTDTAVLRVRDVLDRDPLVVRPHSLADDVTAALESARTRLPRRDDTDELGGLRRQIDTWLARIANGQRELADVLVRRVDDLAATVHPAEAPSDGVLPPTLADLFDEATAALTDLASIRVTPESFAHDVITASDPLVVELRDQRIVAATGSAVLLRQVIETFRLVLSQWYRTNSSRVDTRARDLLDRMCDTYDNITDSLPSRGALADLVRAGLLAGPTRQRAERALLDFSFRVREAALDAVTNR